MIETVYRLQDAEITDRRRGLQSIRVPTLTGTRSGGEDKSRREESTGLEVPEVGCRPLSPGRGTTVICILCMSRHRMHAVVTAYQLPQCLVAAASCKSERDTRHSK